MALTFYHGHGSPYSWRVWLALEHLGLPYELKVLSFAAKDLTKPEFLAVNPRHQVPTIVHDGFALWESLAILEYLDETFPEHPQLLPADARGRSRVRALALTLAADTHPVHNLRVQRYLKEQAGLDDEAVAAFVRHWIRLGFAAFEQLLAESTETGSYCHGDHPTLADCVMVPAVYAARRFGADIDGCATVLRIHDHCMAQEAFQVSQPSRHPDAE